MVEYRGGDIFMNRGDDVKITMVIYAQQNEEVEYEFQPDDKLTFSLLETASLKPNVRFLIKDREFTKVPLEGIITSQNQMECKLNQNDTRYLRKNEYYYVVQLTHGDTGNLETVLYGRLFLIM